jgi:hypothetical protein
LEVFFPNASGFVIDLVDNYTPALAALVMFLFVSREGLRGSLGPLGAGRLYLWAVLLPGVITLVAALLVAATGLGSFATVGDPLTSVLPVLVADTLLNVFGEEYGWRGYLLPKLLPLGELRASLIVGVIWGAWHFPNALVQTAIVDAIAVMVFYLVGNTVLSPLFTRFFVVSGGSVGIAWILHASFNVFGTLAIEHLMAVDALVFGIVLTVVVAITAFAIYRWGPLAARTSRQ